MTHARLGSLAKWFCQNCFTYQRPSSYPCRCCCGYTGKREKVATGVTRVNGQPSRRVPS